MEKISSVKLANDPSKSQLMKDFPEYEYWLDVTKAI